MLWLGIAANLVSFRAMGATMRLTSLAAKGKEITTAFTVIVNTLNRTSFALNTGAMINSYIEMLLHIEDMTAVDLALQAISIAFWAKGNNISFFT